MNPSFLSSFLAAGEPLQGLARQLLEGGGDGMVEPLLDALTEAHEEGNPVVNFRVGEKYYIETLTKYFVGRVCEVSATQVVLEEAACVDDTGRLNEFLTRGRSETMAVEPYPDGMRPQIPLHLITNAMVWPHPLLREVV